MNPANTPKRTEKVTSKELAVFLNRSERQARRYLADMKSHYSARAVLWAHVLDYLGGDLSGSLLQSAN